MAVIYKIKQLNRTFKDGRHDATNGKWFGRAITLGTIDLDGLSEIIQRNCSMKKSDVKAVLTELVEVMTDKLQDSYAVKIDGLGRFKIGLKTKGANSPEEFSVSGNVIGSHINFLPEYTVDLATGKRYSPMLNGAKYSESHIYSRTAAPIIEQQPVE